MATTMCGVRSLSGASYNRAGQYGEGGMMILKEWLDEMIKSLSNREHDPLDQYGNACRDGYRNACCDIRDFLDKAGPDSDDPATASQADTDYLLSIQDVIKDMRPANEIEALARGCPDPARYSAPDNPAPASTAEEGLC